MKSVITLQYQDTSLHASREAWFNATEIASMFDKRPIDWLRLPETERYIQALIKREKEKQAKSEVRKSHITKSKFIKVLKGNSAKFKQGTWLHPKLAVAFARWCDVDFAVWCDEQISELIQSGKQWQPIRKESSASYRLMSEVIAKSRENIGKTTQSFHYVNEAKLCNFAVTGKYDKLDRDSLSPQELAIMDKVQLENSMQILLGKSHQERKEKLVSLANTMRQTPATIQTNP